MGTGIAQTVAAHGMEVMLSDIDLATAEGGKGKSVFSAPSFLGGKNWMPMAYHPGTELFYVPANEWGMDIWNDKAIYKKGAMYLGAGFTIKPVFDDYIDGKVTGRTLVKLGEE